MSPYSRWVLARMRMVAGTDHVLDQLDALARATLATLSAAWLLDRRALHLAVERDSA